MEKKKREVKGISFTKKMVISLVGGLIVGLGFLFLREHLVRSNQGAVWQTINQILFQDTKACRLLTRKVHAEQTPGPLLCHSK